MSLKSSNLLEIKDLKVKIQTDAGVVKAADGINLKLKNKESLCLVGESGCGKSIVALSIMNLLPENAVVSGEVWFKGRNLFDLDKEAMRKIRGKKISMIFEQPMTCLNPVFTVGWQIAEAVRVHEEVGKKEAEEKAIKLMELVKIPSLRYNEYPHQFSGGMQQRVMIAMALAYDPLLIIADEPTTSLDVTTQAQILELLKRLNRDSSTSLFLITHDLGVVAEMCDSIAVMYAGEVVEYTSVIEFFKSPEHPYSRALLGAISDAGFKPISGSVPSLTDLPRGCKFHPRCHEAREICKKKKPEMLEGSSRGVRCHFARS